MIRARRLLLGVAAATSLATAAGILATSASATAAPAALSTPAAHTATAPSLQVTVTAVTPTALAPGTTLSVTGTVRNLTADPLSGVTLSLRARGPLTTRDEVRAWQQATPQDGRGFPLRTRSVRGTLAAGQTVPFSFTVPAGELALDPSAGVPQVVGLAVSASGVATDPAAPAAPLTVARTFTVWQPRPVQQPVRLSILVPVTDPVAATDAAASTSRRPSVWGGRSRLSRLIAATSDTGISWAVDPALLAAASGSTAKPPAPAATPTPTPGASPSPSAASPDTAARSWFRAFLSGSRGRDVSALPWADADVVALAHDGAVGLLDDATATAATTFSTLLGRRPAASVTLPQAGRADAAGLQTLARSGRTTVLDTDALRSAAPLAGGRVDLRVTAARRAGVAPTVLSDRTLSDDLTASGEGALPGQRLLADLAVAAAEHPGAALLVTAPRTWNPDPGATRRMLAGLRSAGWVSLQPYSGLAASAAPAPPVSAVVGYPLALRQQELPAEHVTGVAAAARGLAGFAPALLDRSPVTQLQVQALSLVSLGWRGRSTSALALARTPLTTGVDSLYAGLSVDPGSTKNLLAKEGMLPISVRNGLAWPVRVLLVVTPLSGQLSVKGAMRVTLEPDSSRQYFVPVRAIANGDVDVVASFRTPDGSVVLYQSPRIEVRVRSDWETRGLGVVAVLLALLLFVGLGRGVRRGRGRMRIPPESVPDPDDVGRVAVPDGTDTPTDAPADESTGAAVEEPPPTPATGALRPRGRHADRVPRETSEAAGLPEPIGTASAVPENDVHPEEHPHEVTTSAGAVAGAVVAASGTRRTGATATLPRTEVAVAAGAERRGTSTVPDAGDTPPAESVAATGTTEVDGYSVVAANGAAPANAPPATPEESSDDGSGDGSDGADGSEHSGGDPRSTARLMGSSAVMASGTFLSRVLGMVRVVVLAWAIGAAFSANAFSTANTLPNSLFLLIGGGVLNAVLVPQIVAAMKREDGGREYVDRLLTLSLGVLGVATLVVTAMAPLLLRLFGSPAWTPTEVAVGVAFAFWCLPQVFFYGLYTVLGQVLNARGSFGPYMWAPVVNNVVAIIGMVVFVALYGSGDHPATWWTPAAIAVLAGTTTLGVVAQALVLVPVLRRTGFRWRPRWGFRGVGLRAAGNVAGWTFAALLVGQLGLVLVSRIANTAGQEAGDVGTGRFVYDTAYLLFMLPHSLVAVSVVTAVFTRMSHAVVSDRLDLVRSDVSIALRTTGVATVLATVAVIVLGQDLTNLLFATNSRSTAEGLAWTTAAMVIGLVPFSAQYLFQRVFYAFGDARTPFWVQVVVIAVWSAGNIVAGVRLQGVPVVVGIGVAMSIANVLGALVLALLTRRRIGGIDGRRVLSTYGKCTLAAIGAGVLGWACAAATHLFAGEGHRGALLALIVGGTVIVVVYLAGLRLLRVRELADLTGPLRRVVHV